MIKAVIWDNDGALVDTEELYFKAILELLSEIGVDLIIELFAQISLKQGRSTFDLAAAQGAGQRPLPGCGLTGTGVTATCCDRRPGRVDERNPASN